MLFWYTKGLAYLKYQISQRIQIPVSKLEYNQNLINYINSYKENGGTVILATASTKKYALEVANFLGIFDEVLYSSKKLNLTSKMKAQHLVKLFGKYNFDYAGDHKRDIPVWQLSDKAIFVNISKTAKIAKKVKLFGREIININF